MEPIHVVIASVPWRAENLNLLLGDLINQTLKPSSITVLLDGYDDEAKAKLEARPEVVFEDVADVGSGNWARWIYAHDSLQGVVAMLDDDFRVLSNYLSETVNALQRTNSVVSWHGKKYKGTWFKNVSEDTQIDVFGSGLCAYRAEWLSDIEKDPDFKKVLAERATDDGFMSFFFWDKGINIAMPKGERPAFDTLSLCYDSRSRSKTRIGKPTDWLCHFSEVRGWLKPKSVVLYYSEGSMPPAFQAACFKRLLDSVPISMQLRCVVPSKVKDFLSPLCEDRNVVFLVKECETRGLNDITERLLIGTEGLPANTPVAMAEHDVLYGKGHFAPFHLDADYMWPERAGIRLQLDNVYRRCWSPLLSLRTSAGALRKIADTAHTTEPKGVKIRGWIANYVDIRWGGNITTSHSRYSLVNTLEKGTPEPEVLRRWVDTLIETGVDDPSISLPHVIASVPEAPKPPQKSFFEQLREANKGKVRGPKRKS